MQHDHRFDEGCHSCGAETESLLDSTGAIARKLDPVVVGCDEASGRYILFKDIRNEPFRLPWQPRLTLAAGALPVVGALLYKMAFLFMEAMFPVPLEASNKLHAMDDLLAFLPYALTGALLLSLLAAAYQFWANNQYIERQAWLDELADQVDTLRSTARLRAVCSYCHAIHYNGRRWEATAEGLKNAMSTICPNISAGAFLRSTPTHQVQCAAARPLLLEESWEQRFQRQAAERRRTRDVAASS